MAEEIRPAFVELFVDLDIPYMLEFVRPQTHLSRANRKNLFLEIWIKF